MPAAERHHRRHRIWPWIVGFLVLLIVAIRVAADPLARRFTQQALDKMDGYEGSFQDVKVSFLRLSYTISHLKIIAKTEKKAKEAPYIYVDSVEAHIDWKDALRGRFIGGAEVDRGKLTVELPKAKEKAKEKAKRPALATTLRSMFPFRINRVALHEDEVLVIDRTLASKVPKEARELWIHNIEASISNIASREHLSRGQPTVMEAKATVQRSGKLTLFVTTDLLEPKLNFAGDSSLRDLNIEELWGFIAGNTGVQPVHGTLNAYAAFTCVHNEIKATVKPVLENAKVAPVDKKLSDQIKGFLAEEAIKLTQDNVPGRHANVALIPLRGRVSDPKAELWPTLLSVLRNAYVNAIAGGFYNVPEQTAQKPQGPLKQTTQAFNPKKPMKAQPKHSGK